MEFSINDLVFAKQRGYPFWPGVIKNIDKVSYKTVVKYEIQFFATNETSILNKGDLCSYKENKFKFPTESVAAKHKDDYKAALLEIGKAAWDAEMLLNKKSSQRLLNSTKTPNKVHKSPITDFPVNHSTPTQNITELEIDNLSQVSEKLTREIGVSTPAHLDLNNQLDAITDKCISLEKSLIEEKKKNTKLTEENIKLQRILEQNPEDFHTRILKQEIGNYKTENKNLLLSLEMLQNENSGLQEEIVKTKMYDMKCLRCFPALERRSGGSSTLPEPSRAIETHSLATLSNSVARKVKEKLIIMADSHGRDLGGMIEKRCSASVTSFVKPGAKFSVVVEERNQLTKNLGRSDHVLVIGGTNNIGVNCGNKLFRDIQNLIQQTQHTTLILGTVPMRFDTDQLDLKIITINHELEKIAEKYPNVKILPLHLLPKHYFTRGGIHLNKKGKDNVASMISKMIAKNSNASPIPTLACKTIMDTYAEDINVIDGNMSEIIEELKHDPSVGFAHTISADFEHHRHMSGGVAVIFRRKFNRPDFSTYVDGRLTRQKIPMGSSIYSLVTKSHFNGKPSNDTYNRSFKQLTENFKRLGLTVLVCSPMGCVRDNIGLDLLAKNIVTFQKATNAKVFIVSYDQESTRILRNGLSHPEFLEELRSRIRQEKTMNLESPYPSVSPLPHDPPSIPSTPLSKSLSSLETALASPKTNPSTESFPTFLSANDNLPSISSSQSSQEQSTIATAASATSEHSQPGLSPLCIQSLSGSMEDLSQSAVYGQYKSANASASSSSGGANSVTESIANVHKSAGIQTESQSCDLNSPPTVHSNPS